MQHHPKILLSSAWLMEGPLLCQSQAVGGSPRQEVTPPVLVGDKSLRSRPLHGVPSRVMAVLGQGTWHLSHLLKHEASLCSEKKDAGSEDQVFDAPMKNSVWAGDAAQSVELLTNIQAQVPSPAPPQPAW